MEAGKKRLSGDTARIRASLIFNLWIYQAPEKLSYQRIGFLETSPT